MRAGEREIEMTPNLDFFQHMQLLDANVYVQKPVPGIIS